MVQTQWVDHLNNKNALQSQNGLSEVMADQGQSLQLDKKALLPILPPMAQTALDVRFAQVG